MLSQKGDELMSKEKKESLKASSTTQKIVSSVSSSVRPVCRQYIYDRVSGHSYVPRDQRGKEPRARENVGGSAKENKETQQGNDSQGNDQDEPGGEEGDPTDCLNRPPHFLCYLPPCVRRCPGFFEQNVVCEWAGKWGFHACFKNNHKARRRIFFVGFTFNLIALCLTIVAAMAFSKNYNILTSTSFSRGQVSVPRWGNASTATLNIGFRAVALDDPLKILGGSGSKVSTFNNFCEDAVVGDIERFLSTDLCGECRDSSHQFVLSTVVNIFLILRNLLSDITRMYPRYDSNCSNFYGSLMATLSVMLGMYTIFIYKHRCFENVDQELRPFYLNNFTVVSGDVDESLLDPETLLPVQFRWTSGPGLQCLIAATCLRFVDAICNYVVPTPTITRNRTEQQEYELEFGEAFGDQHQTETLKVEDDRAVGIDSEPPTKHGIEDEERQASGVTVVESDRSGAC